MLNRQNQTGRADISVDRLSVAFSGEASGGAVLNDVSLTFPGRRITGVIGESGSGKSVLGMSLIGLLPKNASVRGVIRYRGRDIRRLDRRGMQHLRRNEIALIPQDPSSALNPIMRIRDQIGEGLGRSAGDKINNLLSALDLPDSGRPYPFQLSGGMKQRALAAMGLARDPSWLLADEPTKGLDARLRSGVFHLLSTLHDRSKTGIILISHDLPFARRLCHRIAVLYCGRIVETGPCEAVFETPWHPYTRALFRALPRNGFVPVPGPAPGVSTPPSGCPFHPRCPQRKAICTTAFPEARKPQAEREVYCHAS